MYKNIFILAFLTGLLSSCAFADPSIVPDGVQASPFPLKDSSYNSTAFKTAQQCNKGEFTGKAIKDFLQGNTIFSVDKTPDGSVYTVRFTQAVHRGHDLLFNVSYDIWGVTFIIHTTPDGSISACTATKQYLRKDR